MKERCRNPKYKQFCDYGGRGIKVCDRWLEPNKQGFINFLADMGERPSGYVIDRINNDDGYSPDNCRWVSRKESQRNQRVTRKVIISGAQYIAANLADINGIKIDTVVERAARGLSYDDVIAKEKHYNLSGLKIGWKYGCGAKNKTMEDI